MKKTILFSILILSTLFTACNDDNDADVKKGKLSGSSWVAKNSFSSTTGNNEYTYTITFTSDEIGKRTEIGWYQVINAATWQMGPKQQVDKSSNFTYVYSPELRTGVIEYSSKNKVIFSISDDFKELIYGSTTYTRK